MAFEIEFPAADESLDVGEEPLFGWQLLAERVLFGYLHTHANWVLAGEVTTQPLKIGGESASKWSADAFIEHLLAYKDRAEANGRTEDIESFEQRGPRLRLEEWPDGPDSHLIVWNATFRAPAAKVGGKEQAVRFPARLPASLVPKSLREVAAQTGGGPVKTGKDTPDTLPYPPKPSDGKVDQKARRKIKRH